MIKIPGPGYLNLEYWFNRFFEFLREIPTLLLNFLEWLSQFHLRLASSLFSIILGVGIIALLIKIIDLRKEKITAYADVFSGEESPQKRTARWEEITRHLDGENPIEWKMAIIEADALLDDIMKGIGYKGETLAERLKSIEPSDFENLQNVWAAHKIRNRLVHEPGKVKLSRGDAKSAVEKYEKALKELKYI